MKNEHREASRQKGERQTDRQWDRQEAHRKMNHAFGVEAIERMCSHHTESELDVMEGTTNHDRGRTIRTTNALAH